GSGSLSAVASGIRWAADNGAKVINLSLGTSSPFRTLERAVNYAWNKGAVLACAAGNAGTSAKTYPAAYTNCISVAATDQNDLKADFSSYGADWVDVAAPGVQILSTMQDQFDWCFLCYAYGYFTGYDALSGTSMATPHVAGLAALVWARGQCTTNACVRSKIESTADPTGGRGTYGRYGRVNYRAAVNGRPPRRGFAARRGMPVAGGGDPARPILPAQGPRNVPDDADRTYESVYARFDSPLMRRVRAEAGVEDVGQHSWVTAPGLRADISRLRLTSPAPPPRPGAGAGGPPPC